MVVRLNRIALINARLDISFIAGADHQIEVSDCSITHTIDDTAASGISVQLEVPATVVLRRNTVSTTGRAIRLFSRLPSGHASFLAVGNVLTTPNPALSHSGFFVDLRGTGTATADLHSNVIYKIGGCACGGAGIDVGTQESVSATVNVTNNTLDDARSIKVRQTVFASDLTVNVFNNVVSRSSKEAVEFPARSDSLAINNGYNDLYKRSGPIGEWGGYPQGPNTFNADPLFVSSAQNNFRLRTGSTIIGAGTNTPPGGLPSEDADGNGRVALGIVDMGAYEFGSTRTGTPTTTTTTTSLILPEGTTTTTLPLDACVPVPTFASVDCRFQHLIATLETQIAPGSVGARLIALLGKARGRAEEARALLVQGRAGSARRVVGRALRVLAGFQTRLGSPAVRRLIDRDLRQSLRRTSADLRRDLLALRQP
jgi:hypothetical protein